MAIRYRILEQLDLVYAQYSRVLTESDIKANFAAYMADTAFRLGRPELIDLSRVTRIDASFYGFLDVLSVVNEEQAPMAAGQGTLTVILAPDDEKFGMARMYQLAAGTQSGIRVEVFRKEDAALAALGRPETTIREFLAAAGIADWADIRAGQASAGDPRRTR
ncbi:MAG: hypothetical protein P1U65_14650 [Minwuia sp.]|nr:hypothetical protein [Minwuia sp.]